MSKLRVLYLAGGYPSPDNPSHGVFNQRAAHALSKYVDLTVIHYRFYKPGRKLIQRKQEDGIKIIVLCIPYFIFLERKFYYLNALFFAFFTNLYCKGELESTHLIHASDGNLSVFASFLKKSYKYKLIAQFIGGELNQDLQQVKDKKWIRKWLQNLDGVSFNSKELHKLYQNTFGNHPNSIIIHRGVDIDTFSPSSEPIDGFAFYFLGGLPNYTSFEHGRNTKGGETLMKAWKLFENHIKNRKVFLNFAGPDSDISEVLAWQKSLNSPDRVKIIGKVSPTEIPDFHRKCNIALIPSLEEGLPNVAMEAAATGNLIIATYVGGIPEVITHNVTGLLCKPGDAESLCNLMLQTFNDRSIILKLGANARSFIEQNFSNINFGFKYFEFYKTLTK